MEKIDKISTTLKSLKAEKEVYVEHEHQHTNVLAVFKLNYDYFKALPEYFEVSGNGNYDACDLRIKVIKEPDWNYLLLKATKFDEEHFE